MATDEKLFCTEGDQPQSQNFADIVRRAWITVRNGLNQYILKNISTCDIQIGLADPNYPSKGIIFPSKEVPKDTTFKLYNEFGVLKFHNEEVLGGSADAEYVVMSTNRSLRSERVLTASNGIAHTDQGAGGSVIIHQADPAIFYNLTASKGLQVGEFEDLSEDLDVHRTNAAGNHAVMRFIKASNQIKFYCAASEYLMMKLLEATGLHVEFFEGGAHNKTGNFRVNSNAHNPSLFIDGVNDTVTFKVDDNYTLSSWPNVPTWEVKMGIGSVLGIGYNQFTANKEVLVGPFQTYNANHDIDFRVQGIKGGPYPYLGNNFPCLLFCETGINQIKIGSRYSSAENTPDTEAAGPAGTDPGDASDCFLYVSGTIGGRGVKVGAQSNGTSIFGGDMFLSGNLYVDTMASTTSDSQPLGKMTDGKIVIHSSDRRLKTNLVELTESLEKVSQLQGYYYSPIEDENKRYIGLVAQEVEEIVPELTTTNPDGYMGIRYGDAVPLLVEAMKEQQQQIKKLEQRIQQLEKV